MCQIIGHLISSQSLFDIQGKIDKIAIAVGRFWSMFISVFGESKKKINDMKKLNNINNMIKIYLFWGQIENLKGWYLRFQREIGKFLKIDIQTTFSECCSDTRVY